MLKTSFVRVLPVYLCLPKPVAFLCRRFAGLRKSVASYYVTADTQGCVLDGIRFPFDRAVMDGKRLIAVACGAIEAEEVAIASRHLTGEDRIVEFGMGMGIAAALVNRACRPQVHHCFEANGGIIPYARDVFADNGFDIQIHQAALGDGSERPFFVVDDYILSSFDEPQGRTDYRKTIVPTVRIQDVIDTYSPTAIFCDIEGAELMFLDPAALSGISKVVVELHPDIYGHRRMTDYIKNFRKAGFDRVETAGTTCFFRRAP